MSNNVGSAIRIRECVDDLKAMRARVARRKRARLRGPGQGDVVHIPECMHEPVITLFSMMLSTTDISQNINAMRGSRGAVDWHYFEPSTMDLPMLVAWYYGPREDGLYGPSLVVHPDLCEYSPDVFDAMVLIMVNHLQREEARCPRKQTTCA